MQVFDSGKIDRQCTVGDYGEQHLLRLVQGFCPSDVVGDDGAIVALAAYPDHQLVVTTDILVEGVHFSDSTTPPDAVGWRSVAANLSDLAAMGAEPLGITVGLGLPRTCPVAWVTELYHGLTRCLDRHGGAMSLGIVGGDLCRSPIVTVSITAFGLVQPQHILRRSLLKVGDRLVVTGIHGASRAGLAILQDPDRSLLLEKYPAAKDWIRAHQYPIPRGDALRPLRSCSALGNPPLIFGGMDSSDGLADALLQLCRASGVNATIDRSALPIPPGLADWVGQDKAIEWTLYGGEDFELVLGLPPDCAAAFLQSVPGSSAIGTVTIASGNSTTVLLVDSQQDNEPLSLTLNARFQHF